MFACVVVTPMGHGTNQVTVKIKDDLTEHLGSAQVTRIISDQNLPTLVRQLALHANVNKFLVNLLSKILHLFAFLVGLVDRATHEQKGFVCVKLAGTTEEH